MSGGSAPGWLRGLSDAVLVIAGFRLGSVFPCHSRLHARAGSVGRRSANGDSVRTAVRELFVEDIREAFGSPDQKHQRCIGAYRQPRRYRVVAPTCLRRDTDVTATATRQRIRRGKRIRRSQNSSTACRAWQRAVARGLFGRGGSSRIGDGETYIAGCAPTMLKWPRVWQRKSCRGLR